MYRMNMAKKVCEDWASLLFNDDCTVRISDEVGEKFVSKVFEENDFFGEANKLTEEAFALGTAAAILRLSDFFYEDGKFHSGERSKISFDYVDAEHIRPISVRNGRIIEAAFVSEEVIRGEEYVYVETHRLEGGEYVITNEFYTADGNELKPKEVPNTKIPRVIHTGSPYPFFFILKPNIASCQAEGSFGFRGRHRLSQGSGSRVQQFLP